MRSGNPEQLLNARQAADTAGVSTQAIYEAVRRGELIQATPGVHIFRLRDLWRYMDLRAARARRSPKAGGSQGQP